jgi:ArsR family transcriptional regulator
MASVFQNPPATPRQASRRRATVDRLLDPALFKALGEPTRARVLACLIKCRRPCSVTEVAACCSIDFSMVARHLAALARAGVLRMNKRGRTVWYEAPAGELAGRFRALADAIEEWAAGPACAENPCGEGSCHPSRAATSEEIDP